MALYPFDLALFKSLYALFLDCSTIINAIVLSISFAAYK